MAAFGLSEAGGLSSGGGGTANITVGTTTITGGTNGYILYDNSGVLGEYTVGTGVATALGINVGSAGAFVVNGGALGTPSSGTLTNATGLPISGITGLGTGAGTALGIAVNTSGGIATYPVSGAGVGLTVGSTTIGSGTTTRILYDNAGVLGEYTLTGSGTVVAMQTSPNFLTSITGNTTSILTFPAAATWQLGAAAVSSGAVAQTLTAQGNTGSTTNGPLFTIQGAGGGSSTSVGGELRLVGGLSSAAAGAGGAITFYTAPSGGGNAGVLALTIANTGAATFASTLSSTVVSASSGFSPGSAGFIQWTSRTVLRSPADAQFNITNAAENAGFGFDVSTDAVAKIRTRAQSGYATVDALGYKVSGTAGASGGPFTAITSITVVNGIITAISGT